MKRHVQLPGIRKWSGSDLIELQSETLQVIDSFLAQHGSAIISGCEALENEITPGLVAIQGADATGNSVNLIAPFAGAKEVSFPVWLTLSCTTIEREYDDTLMKPVAYQYLAVLNQIKPEGKPFLEINETGNLCFWDVIQNSKRRFITDEERLLWHEDSKRLEALEKTVKLLVESSLKVIPDMLSFTSKGGTQAVYVESGTVWDTTSNVPWINVNPLEGLGSGDLMITASQHTGREKRIGVVRVQNQIGDKPERTVSVIQDEIPVRMALITTTPPIVPSEGGEVQIVVLGNASAFRIYYDNSSSYVESVGYKINNGEIYDIPILDYIEPPVITIPGDVGAASEYNLTFVVRLKANDTTEQQNINYTLIPVSEGEWDGFMNYIILQGKINQ